MTTLGPFCGEAMGIVGSQEHPEDSIVDRGNLSLLRVRYSFIECALYNIQYMYMYRYIQASSTFPLLDSTLQKLATFEGRWSLPLQVQRMAVRMSIVGLLGEGNTLAENENRLISMIGTNYISSFQMFFLYFFWGGNWVVSVDALSVVLKRVVSRKWTDCSRILAIYQPHRSYRYFPFGPYSTLHPCSCDPVWKIWQFETNGIICSYEMRWINTEGWDGPHSHSLDIFRS